MLPSLISTGGYTDFVIGVQKNSAYDGVRLEALCFNGMGVLVNSKIQVDNGIANLVSIIIVS